MSKKKYVVLWGATGFRNMGDEAMLAGNLEVLKNLLGDEYTFVVFSYHPEATSQLHRITAKPDLDRLMTGKRLRIISMPLLFLKFEWNIRRFQKVKSFKFINHLEEEFLLTLANCEALFLVGGGNLNDIWVWGGLLARSFTSFWVKSLGKPVFLGAQTVGPLNKRWTRWLARRFLERVDLITLREGFSKKVLEEIGVKRVPVKVVPDDAFNVNPIDKKEAFDLLLNEGINVDEIKKHDKKLIAINTRAWWKMDDKIIHLKKALEEIIKFTVKKDEYYVVFVSTAYGYDSVEDDMNTAKALLGKAEQMNNIKILQGRYNWNQIKGVLGLMDAVIGISYHFDIFATSMGVPALGLYADDYYRLKIGGFFELIGFEDLAVDVRNLNREELISILENFLEREDILKKGLIKKVDEIKDDSCYAAKQLVSVLRGR